MNHETILNRLIMLLLLGLALYYIDQREPAQGGWISELLTQFQARQASNASEPSEPNNATEPAR